ncbi:MAG: phytanoyl-CoA dioxygenase family protein [Oscillatoria sp. PMC 1068.18]|nr:phytanoyl-CoA dioxygenase family protein [Oscillatoria sp. PMC 1076.18]MEC4989841.1 phytanoyl-CoA dioxygenase family protein [Oscillatoria sp. PMC 1068.18]
MNKIKTEFPLTQEQIAHYNEDGYVIVRNFFAPEEIEPLRQACDKDHSLNNTQSEVDYGGTGFKLSVWSELGDSMLGVMPRMARVVDAAEALEGEECYHWHSKIVLKKPGEGTVAWHQGFGTWYEDYCLYPKIVSCCIAINENTPENGCLQIAKGSHHLGRIENVMLPNSNSNGTDPDRLKIVLERLEIVYCEMQPGDAVFFHANTLHGSDLNQTDDIRVALFCTYNVVSNEPYNLENQQHHRYIPLEKVPDSALREKQYNGIFETQKFFEVETADNPKTGVSIRHGRTKKSIANL